MVRSKFVHPQFRPYCNIAINNTQSMADAWQARAFYTEVSTHKEL